MRTISRGIPACLLPFVLKGDFRDLNLPNNFVRSLVERVLEVRHSKDVILLSRLSWMQESMNSCFSHYSTPRTRMPWISTPRVRMPWSIHQTLSAVPFEGVFFAGMISSQRSESMIAFIKGYVTRKNTLFEFFTALDRGISRQKHQELIAQHHTFNGRPKLTSKMPMEKQMSEIYTREKFYVFQGQVMSMVTSSASCVCEGIEEKSYIVADIERLCRGCNRRGVSHVLLFQRVAQAQVMKHETLICLMMSLLPVRKVDSLHKGY